MTQETNELPEDLKKLKADFFRLAIDQKWSLENLWDMVEKKLQSCEEQLAGLKMAAEEDDDLIVQLRLELSIWQSNFKEADEQLKAKDEIIAARDMVIKSLEGEYETCFEYAKRLRKELNEWERLDTPLTETKPE